MLPAGVRGAGGDHCGTGQEGAARDERGMGPAGEGVRGAGVGGDVGSPGTELEFAL